MRDSLINKLNTISVKQKELQKELSKEKFDDAHSILRTKNLTYSWMELEIKKETLIEVLMKLK